MYRVSQYEVVRIFSDVQIGIRDYFSHALTIVGNVHSCGGLGLGKIRISMDDLPNDSWALYYEEENHIVVKRPPSIDDEVFREDHQAVFVHEVGHVLDYLLTPSLNLSRSPTFLNLVSTTKRYELLKYFSQNPQRVLEEFPSFGTEDPTAGFRYLIRPEELWARAYLQYIATKSDDTILRSWLDRNVTTHWKTRDFEPIFQHITDIFSSMGWIDN